MAKKVLIVSAHFYPENFRINDVALDLSHKGYQVEVLTGFPDYPHRKNFLNFPDEKDSHWNGIRIHRFRSISRGDGGSLRRVLNYLSFIFACAVAGLTRNLQKPDVIIVWASSPITVAIPAIWLKKKFRAPLAIWVQDLWPETLQELGILKNSWPLAWMGGIVRWIYKNCDLVWAQSDGFRQSIQAWLKDTKKIKVLYNWGDELVFQSSRIELDSDSRFKILFAGNLGKVQCLKEQLEVVEKLKEEAILWTWIGGGSEEKWLRDEIKKRNLEKSAQVLERVPAAVVQNYGNWADALVVALQTGPALSQTIPSKLQTYLLWKKPVLGMINGEAARIIREAKCGIAFDPTETEAFASALQKFIRTSPKDLQTYGENGQAYYHAHFSKRQILDRLEAHLVSLMESK